MEYNFREIEKKWQASWKDAGVYKVSNDSDKQKCYVLDMFPYPSGAGLHVGHPLGYIASDIYSRYKRLKGFNVLHPMGFDSFGLPAEQYALETGQHPAETTKKNIATFKSQLDKIGFCYDWSREIKTSDPNYYQWTQWIFLQLFESWYNPATQKAEPLETLVSLFEKGGSAAASAGKLNFSAEAWKAKTEKQQQEILMHYRLAFSAYGEVNWCEALGTVLANDEVVNGLSERGGHSVIKKKMRQWYLRITAYADRLLQGLETVEFTDAMKEMQRNWIGRSEGAEIHFPVDHHAEKITVYTTRPETIFGADFLVLAPEHNIVDSITTAGQRQAIDEYINYTKSRSDRERQAEVKQVSGCFTGAYALNPFNNHPIPIWIAEYVLAGYGTGAIMAVPCGDQRDYLFAQHFNIPITNIIGEAYNGEEANATKEATLQHSGFLDGMLMKAAIPVAIDAIEQKGFGKRKVNYKMRDAGFSRQRYWGEPFPIIWEDGIAVALDESELPLELPFVEKYGPGPEGEGPLANIGDWVDPTPNPSPKERGTNADPFADHTIKERGTNADPTPNHTSKERGTNADPTPNPSPKERGTNADSIADHTSKERGTNADPTPNPSPKERGTNADPTPNPSPKERGTNADSIADHTSKERGTNADPTPNPSPKKRGTEHSNTPGYVLSSPSEWKHTVEFARKNRKEATAEEKILWQRLRGKQVNEFRIRRQHPIAGYIPDFVCLQKKLIIEVDGGYHLAQDQKLFDEGREKWLEEYGF